MPSHRASWAVLPGSQSPAWSEDWVLFTPPLRCPSVSEKCKFSGYKIRSMLWIWFTLILAKWTSLLKAGEYNTTFGDLWLKMEGCLSRHHLSGLETPSNYPK